MQHLVYALVDPRNGERFYVGQSSRGLDRPRQHWRATALKERTSKAAKIRSILADGFTPTIEVLQHVDDPDESIPPILKCWTGKDVRALDAAEQRWIQHGRDAGWPLTNMTDGGDGVRGLVVTDEHRANMSKAAKGKPKPQFTVEHRANMSRAAKGKPKSPEHTAKVAAAKTGRKHSKEHAARIAAANTGHSVSQETRSKIRLALQTSPKAIAQRQRLIAAVTGKKRKGWSAEIHEKMEAVRAAQPRRTAPWTPEHRANIAKTKKVSATGRWLAYSLAGIKQIA